MKLTKETKSRLIKAMDKEARYHVNEAKRLLLLGSEIGDFRESGSASGYQEARRYLESVRYATTRTLDILMDKARQHIDYSMTDEDEESKAFNIAKAFALKDAVTMLEKEMMNHG